MQFFHDFSKGVILMDKKRFLIVGTGQNSTRLCEALLTLPWASIVARDTYQGHLDASIDVIMETTGDPALYHEINRLKNPDTLLLPSFVAEIVGELVSQKLAIINQFQQKSSELDIIVNSTHDAMIAVNHQGIITLFNRSAERIMNLKREEVIGTFVLTSIPSSRLHKVLEDGKAELNQEQVLSNQRKIITNRVPVYDAKGEIVGAVAVFRDITEIITLAEEIIDLKGVGKFLSSIINSSEDAISVVDAKGKGMLVNPAYTRLTGLSQKEIVGMPADVDISEGESMHMKVLQTGKPVRGVHMKVGPKKKDVIVNVAPVIVEGNIKGSVGIIHDISELKRLTEELEQAKRIIRTLEAKYTLEEIIGISDSMSLAVEQARRAAQTPATVLLRGESGTGKELFAHAIHNESNRRFNQFIRVNCAAIPNELLESELFGYVEGAFTGAKKGGRRGLFEEASGGTIFLDEIGEMSILTQAKLLRVLQEKEITKIGSSKTIPLDVRVIAATNVHLERAIEQGTFREDLYYRLNVFPIMIPPLRQRIEDISPLTDHLLQKFNQDYGRAVSHIHPSALQRLQQYRWPGNVRELENVVGRSIINMRFTETEILEQHLPNLLNPAQGKNENQGLQSIEVQPEPLSIIIERTEKITIQHVLERLEYNKTKAAAELGVSIRNLYYKMKKYGIG
jgi:PAS domain S-box-containing protein